MSASAPHSQLSADLLPFRRHSPPLCGKYGLSILRLLRVAMMQHVQYCKRRNSLGEVVWNRQRYRRRNVALHFRRLDETSRRRRSSPWWPCGRRPPTHSKRRARRRRARTELQEIVVTGSLIKRTDTETPAPVQVITDQRSQELGLHERRRRVAQSVGKRLRHSQPRLRPGIRRGRKRHRVARLVGGRHADVDRRRAHGVLSAER